MPPRLGPKCVSNAFIPNLPAVSLLSLVHPLCLKAGTVRPLSFVSVGGLLVLCLSFVAAWSVRTNCCRVQVIRMVGESQEPAGAAVGAGAGGSNKMPTLEEYGTNLTAQAEEVRLTSLLLGL